MSTNCKKKIARRLRPGDKVRIGPDDVRTVARVSESGRGWPGTSGRSGVFVTWEEPVVGYHGAVSGLPTFFDLVDEVEVI